MPRNTIKSCIFRVFGSGNTHTTKAGHLRTIASKVSRLKRSAKRPKLAIFWPKKRAVLQRERQFATLYLFNAYIGVGGGGGRGVVPGEWGGRGRFYREKNGPFSMKTPFNLRSDEPATSPKTPKKIKIGEK